MKRLLSYILIALPLIGVVDGIIEWNRIRRVPSLKEWKEAANFVRSNYKKGDFVHFEPYWADQGKWYFKGMDMDISEGWDTSLLRTKNRIWVVASMSKLPFKPPKPFVVLKKHNFKRIQIFLLHPDINKKVVFDLMDLKGAHLSRLYHNHPQKCNLFQDNKWYCGSIHPWRYVGDIVRDTAEGPKRLVWAHPLNHGIKSQLEYTDVPSGDTLEFQYGWSLRAIESDKGSPVYIRIKWDGHLFFATTLDKKNHTWNRTVLPLPKNNLKKHKLTIIWWTINNKDRQFCFKGWIWKNK